MRYFPYAILFEKVKDKLCSRTSPAKWRSSGRTISPCEITSQEATLLFQPSITYEAGSRVFESEPVYKRMPVTMVIEWDGVTIRPGHEPEAQSQFSLLLYTLNLISVPSKALSASLIPPQDVCPPIRTSSSIPESTILLVGVGDPPVGPGSLVGVKVGKGVTGAAVGLEVTGAAVGLKVTGAFVGAVVTGAVVTGAAVGLEVTGAFVGAAVTGASVGIGVTTLAVGLLVGGVALEPQDTYTLRWRVV